nr:hypothetical protein CFP56_63936 [Quercus suber]
MVSGQLSLALSLSQFRNDFGTTSFGTFLLRNGIVGAGQASGCAILARPRAVTDALDLAPVASIAGAFPRRGRRDGGRRGLGHCRYGTMCSSEGRMLSLKTTWTRTAEEAAKNAEFARGYRWASFSTRQPVSTRRWDDSALHLSISTAILNGDFQRVVFGNGMSENRCERAAHQISELRQGSCPNTRGGVLETEDRRGPRLGTIDGDIPVSFRLGFTRLSTQERCWPVATYHSPCYPATDPRRVWSRTDQCRSIRRILLFLRSAAPAAAKGRSRLIAGLSSASKSR